MVSKANTRKNTDPVEQGLFVKSRSPHGFRRGGFHFTPQGRLITADDANAAQAAAILAEPELIVEVRGGEAEDD